MIVMQVVRLFSHVGVELDESLVPCRTPLSQRATRGSQGPPGETAAATN